MRRTESLVGRKFFRLDVISEGGPTQSGMRRYNCRCDCGNQRLVIGADLKRGHAKSCGCLQREKASISGQKNTTHGLSKTKEYTSWRNMISRCHKPEHPRFYDYGGRGITVCDRWRNSFENFLADMGKKPTAKHQIERKENNKGYSPDNCCWATPLEQAQNTRVSRILEHDGLRLTVMEWTRRTGLGRATIELRLKRGWSVAKTLTSPVQSYLKKRGLHV